MRHSMRFALTGVFAVLAWAAGAQEYPSRGVTIIVPYPAGGPTDQLARVLAPKFSEKLGQNFIVENVSGGGTTIATGRVARAIPDGHTLLLHNLQISANVALYPKLRLRYREGPHASRFRQPQSIGAGRPKIARAEHARRAPCVDEDDTAEDGASRNRQHRALGHLAARPGSKGQRRARSIPRRGACAAGHCRRPCRSLLRHASICGPTGHGRTDEGVRDHCKGPVPAVSERRELRAGTRAQA